MLKARGTGPINLNMFGSQKYTKQHCERVELKLRVGEDVVVIKALSFPTICTPIAARVNISNYPHLQRLQLVDTFNSGDKEI